MLAASQFRGGGTGNALIVALGFGKKNKIEFLNTVK